MAFQVKRIGVAGHLYGVSLGKGDLVGHLATCQICKTTKEVDPIRYIAFLPKPGQEMSDLVRQTFPNILEAYADRLEIERKITAGETLDPETRQAFIMEPFRVAAPQVETLFTGGTRIDNRGGLGCLGTLLFCILIVSVGPSLCKSAAAEETVYLTALAVGAIGAFLSLVLMALAPRRTVETEIIPQLAAGLRPLRPSQEEVAACLKKLDISGLKIGKKVKLEKLWQALQEEA
ncbi:MAG: hypothetical protein QM755_01965 [Luteolibacter sp.]